MTGLRRRESRPKLGYNNNTTSAKPEGRRWKYLSDHIDKAPPQSWTILGLFPWGDTEKQRSHPSRRRQKQRDTVKASSRSKLRIPNSGEAASSRRHPVAPARVDSYGSYQSKDTTDRLLPQPDWERHQGCSPLILTNFRDVGNWTTQELRGQLEHLVAENNAAENGDGQFPAKERGIVTENIKVVSDVCDRLSTSQRVREGAGAKLDLYKAINDQLYRRWSLTFDKPRPCVACGDEKNSAELSKQVTARCTHISGCCKPCLRNWTAAQLDTKTWDRIKCPECPEILRKHEIRSAGSRETYERYKALRTRAELSALPNWRFCLSPTCSSGQIHPPSSGPRFVCNSCGHRSCARHDVPWHSGENCAKFEHRISGAQAREHEQASEDWKTNETRVCPKCQIPIEKDGGCDSMWCTQCNEGFSWPQASNYATPKKEEKKRKRKRKSLLATLFERKP